MIGRGLYSKKDKVLPGIYVKRTSQQIKKEEESKIKIYGINDNGTVSLNLTYPFVFDISYDGNDTLSLSATYGFSLSTEHDGEGNVSMEVKSKW
jgi:prophage maintenance system killer protein